MTEQEQTAITYRSKPTLIEAIQHTGEVTNPWALDLFAPGKVRINPDSGMLELLAGTDGAQGWVDVPLYHWLVRMPGDTSDIWPVDPDYFAAKYEPNNGSSLPSGMTEEQAAACPNCGSKNVRQLQASQALWRCVTCGWRWPKNSSQVNTWLDDCGCGMGGDCQSDGDIPPVHLF